MRWISNIERCCDVYSNEHIYSINRYSYRALGSFVVSPFAKLGATT